MLVIEAIISGYLMKLLSHASREGRGGGKREEKRGEGRGERGEGEGGGGRGTGDRDRGEGRTERERREEKILKYFSVTVCVHPTPKYNVFGTQA